MGREATVRCGADGTSKPTFAARDPRISGQENAAQGVLDIFTWIREKGFKANIFEVLREYPQLLTFADWVKKYSDRR